MSVTCIEPGAYYMNNIPRMIKTFDLFIIQSDCVASEVKSHATFMLFLALENIGSHNDYIGQKQLNHSFMQKKETHKNLE